MHKRLDGKLAPAEEVQAFAEGVAYAAEKYDRVIDAMTEFTAAVTAMPHDIKGLEQVERWLGLQVRPAMAIMKQAIADSRNV